MARQAQDRPNEAPSQPEALNRVLAFLQFESGDATPARILAVLSVLPLTLLVVVVGIGAEWLTRGGHIPALQNQTTAFQQEFGGQVSYGQWVDTQLEALAPQKTPWDPAADLGLAGLAVNARAWNRVSSPFWTAMNWAIPFASEGDPDILTVPPLLVSLGLICFSLVVTWIILHTVSELSAARAASGVATRLRLAVYHHAIRLGDPDLAGADANAMFAPQLNLVEEVLRRLQGARNRCLAGIVAFGILALVIDPWLALAGLACLGLTWAIAMIVRENTRSRASHRENLARQSLKLVRDSVNQSRLIRSLGMEVPQHVKVEHWLDGAEIAHTASRRALALGWLMVALAVTVVGSAWLFLAACEVHARVVEAGLAAVQATAMGGLMIWMRGLGRIRRQATEASSAAADILAFLDKRAVILPAGQQEKIGPLAEAIEFDCVTVADKERLLLDQVSLIAPAGERTALVGLDSAQKQSLMLLPGRLIQPLSGEIRWDRLNLKLADLAVLRRQVVVVSARDQLFHGTILENITAGDASITREQAEEAASLVRLDTHVRSLPAGYQTVVGPHGRALPREVCFLVTLARAWLRKPSLWLVEEPPADPANDWADMLDDAMGRVLPGKSVIICPSRLPTLAASDRIVVMDRGKVNAVGTHQALSADNALYRHMLRAGF